MSQTLVCDYSFAHPDPAKIAAAGYVGVVRYLSPDPAKNLTPAELLALHAVGLGVALVWEAGAVDMLGAGPAGASEGAAAGAQARALGWPAGRPIFFAADFAASGGQLGDVAAYLRAAVACGYPVGVYGSAATVDTMMAEGVCGWGWQTSAWSGQAVSARAQLYQRQTPVLTITGAAAGSWDEDVALRPDWGGWTPGLADTPSSNLEPPGRNPWTPLAVDGMFGPMTTRALQWACHLAPQDGTFGPVSKQALQAHLFVLEDGIIGPVTVTALQRRVGAPETGSWDPPTTRDLQLMLNAGTF